MEPDRAAELSDAWVGRHVTVEPPSSDAREAVGAALALVPEPDAAAAITGVDGRPRIAALAQDAVYLVWAVQGSASVREAARCRRIPLRPNATAVEVSQRHDPDAVVRHWWFELEEDPLVFRTTGNDPPERFARALANALGWPG
jgi:hypothetical protein